MSVALNRAFRTLLSGQSKERPELVNAALPFEVSVHSLPCKGGIEMLERLFSPLGYEIEALRHPLDENFPQWGDSLLHTVTLRRSCPLKEFLNHLYVLIPVLDNEKHYFISKDEIEKLLRFGEGWLETHPEKQLISHRYLQFPGIANEALARLSESDPGLAEEIEKLDEATEQAEEQISLNQQRYQTVLRMLKEHDARRVLDLGCGPGHLMRLLLEDSSFEKIVGCDVSTRALEKAAKRLRLEKLPTRMRQRVELFQTALTYRDKRLSGYDAATIVEVIEHLDPPRLEAFRRVVFEFARPRLVLITTPNGEYNVLYESLSAENFRHADHRFEWTRQQLAEWAAATAEEHGYSVSFEPIGEVHPEHGPPTQMAVFLRNE